MAQIDPARLLGDLRRLAEFGAWETGVHRIALSETDIAARRWLAGRMEEAGLSARIDRYGTVLGRSPEASRALLIGSHTDTVPRGGWLDGALGVIYGLEIARALRESGRSAVDVVSFQDEEGSWLAFLGSLSFIGALPEAELGHAKGPGGRPLAEVIEALAIGEGVCAFEPGRHLAFLEAHIEQGPRLETGAVPIGVVTGIVGIRRFRLTATGRADHAGTTPMAMRRDAGRPLFAIAAALPGLIDARGGPDTVWNIGAMELRPGAANVVPAAGTMTVELRDLDDAVLEGLEAGLRRLVTERDGAQGVRLSMERTDAIAPVSMDGGLAASIEAAAEARGLAAMRLPSGAGHDAMIMARVIPSAMMFVPSIGGRSHDVSENTTEEDIVQGCAVLADAAERVLKAAL